MAKLVITLTDTGKKKGTQDNVKIYFPVIPAKIQYQAAAYYQEYNIIGKGPAKIPSGEDISTIGWECFFPGTVLKGQPYVRKAGRKEISTPKQLHNQIEKWRKNGTKLKLNITRTPFSLWVYIDKYDASVEDPHGSIYYTIEFSKVVEVSVEKVKKKGKTTGTARTSKTSSQKKYTVKKGDCLWNIAKKFYKSGAQWKKIYNANKTTIENTAKKHGKKSSSNGHFIFPGTVLKIPQ